MVITQARLYSYVKQTSRDAIRLLQETGKLGEQERELLTCLSTHRDHGLTDGEAAAVLGWPRSSISARRNGISKKLGSHAIVNIGGERRKNPGKNSTSALVWRYRGGLENE